jgi:pimeloyl-ACP methyl ester carboxylesterase
MNGLRGRMLRLPPTNGKKREILIVYGHHASLERYAGLAELLNDFGGVTMPDLPGFGGMESFYKLHEKPTLDNYADYLAAFVKLRYRNRRVSIAAVSFGFAVTTRMLQRYPELAQKVDLLVSVAGFTHWNDFVFTRRRLKVYRAASRMLSGRSSSVFFRNLVANPTVLRTFYHRTHNAKHKFMDLDADDREAMTNLEINLWRDNDMRTHMATTLLMFNLDNCTKQIKLPVWHISVQADNYFNNHVVEEHLRIIFTKVTVVGSISKKHMPNVLAGKHAWDELMPVKIKKLLLKDP